MKFTFESDSICIISSDDGTPNVSQRHGKREYHRGGGVMLRSRPDGIAVKGIFPLEWAFFPQNACRSLGDIRACDCCLLFHVALRFREVYCGEDSSLQETYRDFKIRISPLVVLVAVAGETKHGKKRENHPAPMSTCSIHLACSIAHDEVP